MLQWAGDEGEASQTFSQLAEGNPAIGAFVREPSDCPCGSTLRDAQLEAGEVELVAKPFDLYARTHLLPLHGRAQDLNRERWRRNDLS